LIRETNNLSWGHFSWIPDVKLWRSVVDLVERLAAIHDGCLECCRAGGAGR
jgi:hypothetical protein